MQTQADPNTEYETTKMFPFYVHLHSVIVVDDKYCNYYGLPME